MVSTRRSISSSSASASASGAANNNNNNNNNSNTLGFVPPTTLPGRKILRTRTMQHRKRRRQDLILVTISVAAAIVFVVPFVLFFYSKSDNSQQLIQQSNKIDAALNVVDQEKQKQKQKNHRGGEEERNIWVSQKSQPFNERGLAVHAENLVMVAGHSVTVSGHLQDADSDESDWFLLGYQKGQGLPQAIHAHIAAGIEEARKDPKSMLVFSGGETRAISGPQTEAQAYYHVADAMNLWPTNDGSSVRARTTTEEFATDSFENLMFSICRFREITGEYPKKITVVSFSFKRRRFETLHAPALRWPADRFAYIGVDPTASTGFDLQRSTEGESKNAAAPFAQDPYGCHTAVLQEKRKSRNPFQRTPPYGLSCPEMKELLKFCGPELIPVERIPWR